MKNLVALEKLASMRADVHLISRLILTLLGLIVFPKEGGEFDASYDVQLDKLNDWPKWDTTTGEVKTLKQLLINLRHAVSHRNIEFSSEGRRYEDVYTRLSNIHKHYDKKTKVQHKTLRWRGGIEALALRVFCDRLAVFILHK